MPTLLEAAGVATDQVLDGRSMLRTITGKPQPVLDRDLFWGRREGGNFKGGYISAIRRGDWKLLQPMPEEAYELYNLATDPMEEENLAEKRPEKFEELKKALEAQLARYAEVPWKPPELRG
jgi:arylsulfatase A-like enzyme